jgi:capsular exopolysaccharide synthesis family protein
VTILSRRRRWLVGAVVVAVAISAVVSYTTTSLYMSTSQLTYVRQADISSALGGTTLGLSTVEVQREAETYAALMSTDEMKVRAGAELGHDVPEDVTVSAEYVPDTTVLRISAVSADAAQARDVANAYATGFTKWRRKVAVTQYQEAERIILEKMSSYGEGPAKNTDPGYLQLMGRLQDIRVLEAAATGNFVIASAGALPAEPFLPQHMRDLVIGLLIGIVAGIGLVALVEQLDVRVHTVDDLAALSGLPILARLPRPARSSTRDAGLEVVSDPAGPMAEAFRMFRGNLDFVNVDGQVSSIIFSSAMQGEGKTTTLCNLAVTLARAGKRVVVADCDMRRPRVHRYFDLDNRNGLSTVVTGHTTIDESLRRVAVVAPDRSGRTDAMGSVAVLTAGPVPPNPGEIVASRRLSEILGELEARGDLVLIDAPPFLVVGDSAALAKSAHGIIVVARLDAITKAMMKDTVELLQTLPVRCLGMVVTNVSTEGSSYRYRYYRDQKVADASEEAPAASTEAAAAIPAAQA